MSNFMEGIFKSLKKKHFEIFQMSKAPKFTMSMGHHLGLKNTNSVDLLATT